MSNESKRLRREIVERVRHEGYLAALAGRHRQTCPYRYMDEFQWLQGYRQGEAEIERAEEEEKVLDTNTGDAS